MFSCNFRSGSPTATYQLGRALGSALLPAAGAGAAARGAAIGLWGDLGSGKTTFTRGLAAGLGVREEARVSSPTFVLKQDYQGNLLIHHYDAYRLSGPAEFLAIGFEEDLASGAVVVVEWADRVAAVLPEEALRVEFEHELTGTAIPGTLPRDAGRRRIAFSGDAAWEALVRSALAQAGGSPETERDRFL
jgi:tRNA threonylcarbamoyladenosine biosynthesis protein TsaE